MGEARSNTCPAGVSLPAWLCAHHIPASPQIHPALPPGPFPMGPSPKGVKKSCRVPKGAAFTTQHQTFSIGTAPSSCTDHLPPLITFLPSTFSFKPKHPLAPISTDQDFSFDFSSLCLSGDLLHFAVSAIQELTQASTPQIDKKLNQYSISNTSKKSGKECRDRAFI